MFKRLFQWLVVLLVLSVVTIGFAAPEQMPEYDNGNMTGLIILNNPKETATFEKDYVLSGSCKQGVIITVYIYSPEEDIYKKVYIVDGDTSKAAEWQAGGSGLFMQEIQLSKNKNSISLRAAIDDSNYQVVKLDVELLNKDFLMRLKDLSINIGDVYDKIFR